MKPLKKRRVRKSPSDPRGYLARRGFLAVCLFLLAAGTGCSEKIEPGNTLPPQGPVVKAPVIEVRPSIQPVIYDATGTVKAQVSATISSKLMGVIQAFKVREGDLVKKGDLLVILDERQVSAQVSQAQAALAEARKAEAGAVSAQAAAEAGAEQSFLAYRRNRTMLEGGAITQEMYEAAEAQYKQTQAALAQAEAMVEAARYRVNQAQAAVEAAAVALKDARVLAPFSGKVTEKLADTGGLAAPGTPLLAIEQEGGYRIDLVVPEAHIQTVRTGQSVAARIPAIGDAPLAGTVNVIIPSADQGSRTFVVQVGLPANASLRSGMFARVALVVGEKRTIQIPASAVVRRGQLTGIFMVDQDNTARFRLIRTGRSYNGRVEVISGIQDGTRLVTALSPQLANGSSVEPEK